MHFCLSKNNSKNLSYFAEVLLVFNWTLNVIWTAFYEITLVRLSFRFSVLSSVTNFGISFFLILYMMIVDHDI